MSVYAGPNATSSGLVLHIDPSNPRCYPGSGTTLFDLSGNGNNGTLTNGATYNGANGGNIVFDGINDYINISPTGYNLGVNFTLQLWTKVVKFGGYLAPFWNRSCLISNSYPYSSNQGFLFNTTSQAATSPWVATPGRETFFLSIGQDQFGAGALPGSLTSYIDKWVNLSAVINATNLIRLYINSIEPTYLYQDNGPSSLSYTGGPFSIGVRNNSDDFLQGSMSNILIYNRALSPIEIAQNFNATRGRYGI